MAEVSEKSVLILQLRPEDDTADSEFAAILHYGELDVARTERVRVEQTSLQGIELDRHCAIVVGGSPFDVSLPQESKSALQLRIEGEFMSLLGEVVPRDLPFLGCCSGCSLLGRYLGAPISTRYAEPVTCTTVQLTVDGREDPLLEGTPERIDVLCGHKEACDEVPTGAKLLLTNEACPVQMFRVGSNVYATQFHPEGDAAGFELRIAAYRDHGYFHPNEADDLIERIRKAETPHAREILRRFVARYT